MRLTRAGATNNMEQKEEAEKFAKVMATWWFKDQPYDLGNLGRNMRDFPGVDVFAQWYLKEEENKQ